MLWLWVPHRRQSRCQLGPQSSPGWAGEGMLPSPLPWWLAGLGSWLALSQAPASAPGHTDLSTGHSMAACFVRAHKQEEPERESLGKMEAPVICHLILVESLDPAHSPGDYIDMWLPGSSLQAVQKHSALLRQVPHSTSLSGAG